MSTYSTNILSVVISVVYRWAWQSIMSIAPIQPVFIVIATMRVCLHLA